MSEIINPEYRDNPCDESAGSNSAKSSGRYVCCRCGAQSASEESLCAPSEA